MVERGITQAANDKQQAAPILEQLKALPKHRDRLKMPIAGTEYASQNNVNACEQAKSRSLIALVRQAPNPSLDDRSLNRRRCTNNLRRSKRCCRGLQSRKPRLGASQTSCEADFDFQGRPLG